MAKSDTQKCKRCGMNVTNGWSKTKHFKECTVVLSAQNKHLRNLRNIYYNVEGTPMSSMPCENNEECSVHNHSPPTQMPHQHETSDDVHIRLDNVTRYLDSQSLLDTTHIRECLQWGPDTKAITDQARITLKFLSSVCMEDGLTRSQMKAILKFVKSLSVADSKLLPDSVGTCWKVIEKVRYFSGNPNL
jgi:hypothetical protein